MRENVYRTEFDLDPGKKCACMQDIEKSDLGSDPSPRGPPRSAALVITSVRTALSRERRDACACRGNRPQDGRRAVSC